MEPPFKRRRLPDAQEREQLDKQRAQNDLRLKSRFESIFEKYSKDFTGVGDVIDLETGKLIVNNGHLITMEHERDIEGRANDEDELGADFSIFPTPKDVAKDSPTTERSPAGHQKKLFSPKQDELPPGEVPCVALDVAAAIKMDDGSMYDNSVHGQLFIDSGILKRLSRLGPHIRKSIATVQRSAAKSVVVSVETEDLTIDPKWRVPEMLQQKVDAGHNKNTLGIEDAPANNPAPELEPDRSSSPDGPSLWTLETSLPSGRRQNVSAGVKWSAEMDQELWEVFMVGALSYKQIAAKFPGRTSKSIELRLNHLKLKMRLNGQLPTSTTDTIAKTDLPTSLPSSLAKVKEQHTSKHDRSAPPMGTADEAMRDATEVPSKADVVVNSNRTRQLVVSRTPPTMDKDTSKGLQANDLDQRGMYKKQSLPARLPLKPGSRDEIFTVNGTGHADLSENLADALESFPSMHRGTLQRAPASVPHHQQSQSANPKQTALDKQVVASAPQVLVVNTARISGTRIVSSCKVPYVEKGITKSTPSATSKYCPPKAAQKSSKPTQRVKKSPNHLEGPRQLKTAASRVSTASPILCTRSLIVTEQPPTTPISEATNAPSALKPSSNRTALPRAETDIPSLLAPSSHDRTSPSFAKTLSSRGRPTARPAKAASRGSTPDPLEEFSLGRLPQTPVTKRSMPIPTKAGDEQEQHRKGRRTGPLGVPPRPSICTSAGELSDDELQ